MTEQTPDAILSTFLSSADDFTDAVRGFMGGHLDLSAEQGGWTVRQIVHHVADDGDAWCFVLKKAVACPGAVIRFEGFPGNERWADALHFETRPVEAELALIQAHRMIMAEIARLALPEWESRYVEIFGEDGQSFGKMPVGRILEMLTEHMQEHLKTLKLVNK